MHWRSARVAESRRGAAPFAAEAHARAQSNLGVSGERPALLHEPTVLAVARRFVGELAAQDWLVLTYCAALAMCVLLRHGPHMAGSLGFIALDVAIALTGMVVNRVHLLRGRAAVALYRATLLGAMVGSYLQLRYIMIDFGPLAVDGQLLGIDTWLFGRAPAHVLDAWTVPPATEWFSFFYYSYFFILAAHVLPVALLGSDDDRSNEFTLGVLLVFGIAQVTYLLVPAYGPYFHLAGHFQNDLVGGVFWKLVKGTVDSAGAQLDVFPSVHTAAPTFISLFSIRHRRSLPFRYTWPWIAFITSQIIIATVYLRWHYVIDIFAGITLASFAVTVAPMIRKWERARV